MTVIDPSKLQGVPFTKVSRGKRGEGRRRDIRDLTDDRLSLTPEARRHLRFAASARLADDVPEAAMVAALIVHAGSEDDVIAAMRNEGIDAFSPRERVHLPKTRKRAARVVERLVTPDYVFVRCIPSARAWQGLMTFRRVIGFVGCDSRPWLVSVAVMETFRADVENLGKGNRRPKRHIASGDRVVITTGPFESFEGVVVNGYRGQAYAPVELSLFGRVSNLLVSVDSLARLH